VEKLSQNIGIDRNSLIKALNFLPYPFLLSEYREGAQHNIFVNKRFKDEISYTCEDIPTIEDWFLKAYPDAVYRAEIHRQWLACLEKAKGVGEDAVVMQAKIQTKNAGSKWYEVKASVLGPINFVVFVNIDNEIMRERELVRMNENNNRILSILSHDLRSPLGNLWAALELATNKNITRTEETEILKKLSFQVFELRELLDTTLQWSRTNFSEIQLGHAMVNIKPIVCKYLNVYRDAIKDKQIQVLEQLHTAPTLVSDPEIISIVLRNLISNAIKYTTPCGTITITDWVDDRQYSIGVENSGNGITQERIVDILRRTYASELGTNGEKGLGLGLKLCQQLLEKIEGRLSIESRDKHIAMFKITIPIRQSTGNNESMLKCGS